MAPRLLNLGCGAQVHPSWVNVDLNPRDGVIGHDARKSLPFPESTFDAVYSSHLIEHLSPVDGERLVRECHRVLRAGGVIRIVVPDLEGICRAYLCELERFCADPSPQNQGRHRWMTLELVDQLVREESGGAMARDLISRAADHELALTRCGDEIRTILQLLPPPEPTDTPPRRITLGRLLTKGRALLRRTASAMRRGKPRHASDPRASGEVHRWMYDRASLRSLLGAAGFQEIMQVTFDESRIAGWQQWRLDHSSWNAGARKPDSLYMEATKDGRASENVLDQVEAKT